MTPRRKQHNRATSAASATPPRKGRAKKSTAPKRRPETRTTPRVLTAPAPAAAVGPPAVAGSTAVADPPADPRADAPAETTAPDTSTAPDDQGAPARPAAEPDPDPAPAQTAQQAFDRLYLRRAGRLVRQVELLTGDAACARQAVAHAYRLAWQRWPEVARDSDPVGWVRAAAYEYALAPWQRWLPARSTPPAAPAGRPRAARPACWQRWLPGTRTPRRTPDGRPARASAGAGGIEAALLELPAAHRKAVMLHDGLGIGVKEAAIEVEATASAATARIAHARAALVAAVPGLADGAVPERLGALLGAEPEPEPPDRPAGVRNASERAARRRTVGAYALTGVIAALTTVAIVLGPVHPTARGQHGGAGPSPTGERAHAAVGK
jgi:DNA-directed RNA polymerase specialized sigma24 family protein